MRYVYDSPLTLGHKVWQLRPPQPSLTLVVKGTFELGTDGGAATFAAEPVPTTGELFWDDDASRSLRTPSDFALIKPKGECFVIGRAWAPGGKPATAVSCRFRLGPIEKRVAVFGDRAWQKGLTGRLVGPEPFTSMPLAMDFAYGGAGYKPNPWGRGRDAVDGVTPLPNLERPDDLVTAPSSKPAPVILGPLPVTWPSRQRYAGTYDQTYMKTRWPWLPANLDWRFFLEAPEDQQLPEGHWRGDERIEVDGLHPRVPSLHGRLPGLRPRVFLDARRGEEAQFVEVPVVLDTVTWDGEIGKLLLTWRGSTEVASEQLEDTEHIYLTHDPLAGPARTPEQLRARCRAILEAEDQEEEEAEGEVPPDVEATIPDGAAATSADEEVTEVTAVPTPEELELEAELEAMGQKVAALRAEEGPDPEPPDPKEALRAMKEGGMEVSPELEEMLNQDFHDQGLGEEEVPEPEPTPEGRALLEARMAAGEPVRELDLSDVDLSFMDLSGLDLTGSMFARANLTETKLANAILVDTSFASAEMLKVVLSGAQLQASDLTGANLQWADLMGANLSDAEVAGARLLGARLAGAVAHRTVFQDADLTEAVLAEGDFLEADFERARLDRADLLTARLVAATLEGVSADQARFERAVMTGVRAEGLVAKQAHFGTIDAEDSFWEGAELSESNFAFARLTRADFTEAVLIGVVMDGALVRDARFDRANAHSLMGRKSDFMEASFESADLTLSDLAGSNLFGAQLWRAKLEGARLELADLTRTLHEPK